MEFTRAEIGENWNEETPDAVHFSWAAKNCGFGETVFYKKSKEEKKWRCHSECMTREFVKEMLCKFVDDCEWED